MRKYGWILYWVTIGVLLLIAVLGCTSEIESKPRLFYAVTCYSGETIIYGAQAQDYRWTDTNTIVIDGVRIIGGGAACVVRSVYREPAP